MKALVYTAERELTYRDEPAPQAAPGEALVAIESAGICGSDMHAYLGHDPRRVPPLILGHEAAGRVVEGGGELAGRAVALNPLITCGRCDDCMNGRQNLCANRELIGMVRPGAFAECVSLPVKNLMPLPDGMRAEHAALCEPGATALHAIRLAEQSLARPVSEARALVIGGGSVGLLCALMLLDKGAGEVHLGETNQLRRDTAARALAGAAGLDPNEVAAGNAAHRVFDPLAAKPEAASFDVVFDAVGNTHTRESAIECARSGGVIVHIGLQDAAGGVDVRAMTLRQNTLSGCYTYTPSGLRGTLSKLHAGALGALEWLEQRPLAQGARAFADLLAGDCAAAKVVLTV